MIHMRSPKNAEIVVDTVGSSPDESIQVIDYLKNNKFI